MYMYRGNKIILINPQPSINYLYNAQINREQFIVSIKMAIVNISNNRNLSPEDKKTYIEYLNDYSDGILSNDIVKLRDAYRKLKHYEIKKLVRCRNINPNIKQVLYGIIEYQKNSNRNKGY